MVLKDGRLLCWLRGNEKGSESGMKIGGRVVDEVVFQVSSYREKDLVYIYIYELRTTFEATKNNVPYALSLRLIARPGI